MHFFTLALLHLLSLAILAHAAIIPPKRIGIGAISRTHDVDTLKVAHLIALMLRKTVRFLSG